MYDRFENKITSEREGNKFGLETFSFGKHNNLDYPIDRLIKDIKDKIDKLLNEHDELIKLEKNNPRKYDELNEIAQQTGHSLEIQQHQTIDEVIYLQDELFAVYEVKIIYAFKHFEVNLKKLLNSAYKSENIEKRMKWNDLIFFLKSKDIIPKNLNDYKEVNQLRLVNNSLKHSEISTDKSIESILEFKDIKDISYENLEQFYDRIKEYPIKFLQTLSNEIYKNLYEFNDEKIKTIAKSLALRMNKDIAKKTAKELIDLYD